MPINASVPRTDLGTHVVFNQGEALVDVNLFDGDWILTALVEAAGGAGHIELLSRFGARAGSEEVQYWGELANRNPPQLRAFDRFGQRIDEVEFHPAYHALMALGLEAGTSSIAWTAPRAGHVAHSALLYLLTQAEAGVGCPMSMTYAGVAALRKQPEIAELWEPRIAAARYDARCLPAHQKAGVTLGMAMTEKQGGSDVRANSTVAIAQADGSYALTGHKWFVSGAMGDGFLALAKINGDDTGLSCFFVPRWRLDGSRNTLELQRLKDKMGDRSNATCELELREAAASLIGPEGRGVATILEMVQHTRLDCVTGAAATMRVALSNAIWHAQRRSAFGRRLIDQPMMRQVLADLVLESSAATALAMRTALAFDRSAADPAQALLARLMTPIAKYWVCRRATPVVAEAMECLGGSGYVEESPLARAFRQAPLNGIWEGSGNVIVLDTLRVMQREPEAVDAMAQFLLAWLPGQAERIDAALIAFRTGEPTRARQCVEYLAILLAGASLVELGLEALGIAYVNNRLAPVAATSFGAVALESGLVDELIEWGALESGK